MYMEPFSFKVTSWHIRKHVAVFRAAACQYVHYEIINLDGIRSALLALEIAATNLHMRDMLHYDFDCCKLFVLDTHSAPQLA